MPTVRTYDDVDTLFKLNEDGESSRSIVVLGEEAYTKAIAEGWTDISKLPKLPFPTGVYRLIPGTVFGEVKRIENRAQLTEALKPCNSKCLPSCKVHGWGRDVIAAPPEVPPAAAPVAPAASSAATVELALQLVAANTRAADQDKKIAALKTQNAEILEILKSLKPKKGEAA
jgi:hypothetical protein